MALPAAIAPEPLLAGLAEVLRPEPPRPLVCFWAPCEPPTTTAQQKGVCIIQGKPRFFTKTKVKAAATLLTWVFKRYRPSVPLDQPLSVVVRVVYPWPKSTPKRLQGTFRPHDGANPDVDNAYKLIGDVLTELGFWRDDGLVFDLHVTKWRGPRPGVGVKIYPCSEDAGEDEIAWLAR